MGAFIEMISYSLCLTDSFDLTCLSVYVCCYKNQQPLYRHNIVFGDTNGKVIICRELKNSSDGTMRRKTTEDLKT